MRSLSQLRSIGGLSVGLLLLSLLGGCAIFKEENRRTLNLLDEQAVCAEMKTLVEACEWDKLQALSTAHACAKQRQALTTAEAAFLASLPPAECARRVSIGRVNFGG